MFNTRRTYRSNFLPFFGYNRLENTVAKIIGYIVDSVDAGLVPEGVGAGDTLAEGGSLLLVGVVDVPVAEGGVAGLVL